MSLFQCSLCGCCENTALANGGYHSSYALNDETHPAMASYRAILGLKPGEKAGVYCSACNPMWFTDEGSYGVGPNPNPKPEQGLWHGEFERMFLPMGEFETNAVGNLQKKSNKDDNIKKYVIKEKK